MNSLRLLKYTLKTEGSNLPRQISILLPRTGFERFCTKNMWPSLHIYTCVLHLQLQKILCLRSVGCNTIFYLTFNLQLHYKNQFKLNLWKRTDGEISSLWSYYPPRHICFMIIVWNKKVQTLHQRRTLGATWNVWPSRNSEYVKFFHILKRQIIYKNMVMWPRYNIPQDTKKAISYVTWTADKLVRCLES
jgi:hypothetical protein